MAFTFNRRWPVLIALVTVAGCSDVWSGQPAFQTGLLMPVSASTPQPIEAAIPTTCADLLSAPPPDTLNAINAAQRNACIYAMMTLIDRAYYEYRKNLRRTVDAGHTAADIVAIGLGSAGALVGGATTKSILAAASAGVAGIRTKIDTDVLYSHSITLIITQMDADRADWKSRIIAQIADSRKSATYTMYQAANDLLAYFQAGTWDHALVSLDTHASANLSNCQLAVKNAQLTAGGANDTGCGPIPVVTPVAADIQAHRRKLADFVKKMSAADQRKLSNALALPAAASEGEVLGNILDRISAATTAAQVDDIAAKVKSVSGKDI